MQLDNLIQAGTVVEADANRALVKVNVLGAVSDWLPILMQANSFKKHWVGLRVGMQVLVLANRYVLGSIYNKDCAEPSGASDTTDIQDYDDGTLISYDSKAHHLDVHLVAGATLSVQSTGGINFKGDVTLDGALDVSGITTVQGKAVARVGDHVSVSSGSSAGSWPIAEGSR